MKKKLLFLLLLFSYTAILAKTKDTMQKPADTLITYGPYALVAGGSKGIGYAIAEALAKRHYNLVLVARNWDSLSAAKTKLESAYGIHVELLSYDLSREESATAIAT